MKKKISGVLIDTETSIAKATTLSDTLDSYYTALHCNCIDIVSLTIGKSKKYFSIVFDDEGLFKDSPCVSAVSDIGEPMLVGSLFIADFDPDTGELVSLSDKDLKYVLNHIVFAVSSHRSAPSPLLCQVGY